MADTAISITAGSGTNIDTRTEATNGNHRQVVVLGDPSTNAGVAPVDATKGLAVDLTATGQNTTALKVDGSAVTQPISAASLPLPSGAATSAKQPALGTAGSASTDVLTVQGIASMTALKVDGSATTQPISASSLPLPTGAATSAKQDTGNTSLGNIDTSTTNIPNVIGTAASAVPSKLLQVGGSDGTNARAVKVNTSGQMDIRPLTTSDAVTATLNAETTKVIGTVRNIGNAGAVMDGVVTAATAPANGLMGLGIYNSTEPSPTTGQSVGIQLDSKGRQRQVIMDAAGNTRGANVDASNRLSVTVDNVSATNISTNIAQINGVTPLMGNGTSGTGALRVAIASDNTVLPGVGAGATGSAVPANASYGGAIAKTALPSAGTDANLVGVMADKFGRQVVLPGTIRDLVGTQTTTISASTSETTIVTAGAAGVFNDLVLLVISNTSATAARVDIRDATAGSILFSLYVPAGDVRGFSLGGSPIPQTTAANNWTAQSSASVTDLRVYAVFHKNK